MTVEELAHALGGAQRTTEGWKCLCPAHDDARPSLYLKAGDKQPIVFVCRSVGCTQDAIIDAIKARGLSLNATAPPKATAPKGASCETARITYRICDRNGNLVAEHMRVELADYQTGENWKDFFWRRNGANGLKGLRVTSLPLYRTEILASLPDGATVVITEGEKAADALVHGGFNAVGTVTGAKQEKGDVHDDAALAPLLRFRLVLWPDNDDIGRAHMARHAAALKRLGARDILTIDWKDAPAKGDAADFEGSNEALLALIDAAQPFDEAVGDAAADDSVWSRAQPVSEFLAEGHGDDNVEWLVEPITAKERVTFLVSPRGLGKSHLAHAIAVAVAQRGLFAGRPVRGGNRVLLLDRDNPRREIRPRLRAWGAGKLDGEIRVMTRESVPPLTDQKAWAEFPIADYDLIILDSFSAATEGVDETAGGDSGKALAPLLDVARKGVAVLILANTDKAGAKIRGSGVVPDRSDVILEVRDLTDVRLDPKKQSWVDCLPESGEQAWLDKSKRRKRKDAYRVALFPSKYRLDKEIEPFVLELRLSGEVWDLMDVTAQVEVEFGDAQHALEDSILKKKGDAVDALRKHVDAGAKIGKTQAAEFLQTHGLRRNEARDELDRAIGRTFAIVDGAPDRRGRPSKILKLLLDVQAVHQEEAETI